MGLEENPGWGQTLDMNHDPEFEKAVAHFVGAFEHVFGDDWEHTKECMKVPDLFVDPKGTFINPAEFDESNNWCSRYALLETYRKLVEAMLRRGIKPMLAGVDDPESDG